MKTKFRLVSVALILLMGAFACAFLVSRLEPQFETVDQAYVKAHMDKPGFLLVDVREEEVYNGKAPFEGIPGGHIPGAINFPGSVLGTPEAAASLARAGLTKNTTLILYCNAGLLSGQFAETLVKDFHFKDSMIKTYKAGTLDWSRDPANKLEPEEHELGTRLTPDKK